MTDKYTKTGVHRRRTEGYMLLLLAIVIAVFFLTLLK